MDFSDKEFVQEIEFLSKNKYYVTSLNFKLKLEEYIHDKDEKIKNYLQKVSFSSKKVQHTYVILIILLENN